MLQCGFIPGNTTEIVRKNKRFRGLMRELKKTLYGQIAPPFSPGRKPSLAYFAVRKGALVFQLNYIAFILPGGQEFF